MSKNITGVEYSLDKIFSADFEFIIPTYQRPYAWTVEQTEELFDDLYDFYQENNDDDYFLGSIVLIKEENNPVSYVIDGQQRLTTLSILFAVLSDVIKDDEFKRDLRECIVEPGKKSVKRASKPRLTLRERDKDFFFKYIQNFKFNELFEIDETQLSTEAQINIKRNSELLHKKFSDEKINTEDNLENFITFLLTRCYLVTVSTTNRKSAFRVFSVMNSRGLDLQPTDIFKADIIGDSNDLNDTKEWEQIEVDLGRNEFNNLFVYIRMIYAKEKARKALVEDFPELLSRYNIQKTTFVESILIPYSKQLEIINKQNYKAESYADEVNQSLSWLNRIGNSDWKPVVIRFLRLNDNNAKNNEYIKIFLQKLERLAAMMLITGKNINDRISRYSDILKELDSKNGSLDDPINSIELSDSENQDFIAAIKSDVYKMTTVRRNYLLLRLDSFISDNAASYKTDNLTIEHVLPQTISPESDWARLWTEDEQKTWVHKLANLVLLNKRRNIQAQNYEFEIKKEKYFSGSEGVSSFALTSQVLSENSWTPEFVENRQSVLLKKLQEKWELKELKSI